MEEETQPGVEEKQQLNTKDEEKCEEKEETKTETFKKPAKLAVPSLANRRNNSVAANMEEQQCESNDAAERQQDVAKKQVMKMKGTPVKAGKFPPLPYTQPPWGGPTPEANYALEILKNGTIVDTVPLTHRSYFVVGRLPVCDVPLEHPSISRYHAVIQYRGQAGEGGCVGEERGFYVHDLGSTHGTVVNKNKIPPKTYVRLRVGHVLKFGGSSRLFILQGPESDEEEESELTVTELRERARKQRAELEKKMMGELSDGEGGDDDDDEEGEGKKSQSQSSREDSGCSWGMEEDAAPEQDENEENPFSTEFQEDQEAAYLKDPKKALQGFYDREGEELEFEYEDQNHGTWLCRIKLPVDDALGRQLVAEVSHTGKKKEAAVQCCLEACRMLEARGLLRQEAVSRKRKQKNWEDEDYYDSDDDTFLDRTGTVERKRQERMKKAGKIEERTETYESLVAKLSSVEKELADTQKKLNAGKQGSSASCAEDSLDAFMTAVRSEAAMDAVQRRKLHIHVADLRKEAQRLRKLVDLTRPAQMPSLLPSGSSEAEKPKKTLPLFGAMKGGSRFKLKTGTIGKLPPKRPNLPAELFNMKELPSTGEEEEEEEQEQEEKDEEEKEQRMEEEKEQRMEEEKEQRMEEEKEQRMEEEKEQRMEEEKEQRMEEEKEQRMEEEHETAEKVEREKDGGDKCSATRSKANGEESDAPLGSLKEPQEVKGKNSWKVPLLKWVHIS
uniref:Solute carrier family 4 member 1 adaptor protein n=1 Tax=Cyprinodon variegatus TaxID=28743 RepID=A0A3Q2FFR1_CYPVA